MSIEEFIKNLTKEDLDKINEEFAKKESNKASYQYSKIKDIDLKKLFEIKRVFDKSIFNLWFKNNIILNKKELKFLKELLGKEENYIKIYKEEDLKIKFITPILNKVNFRTEELRDFYEEKLFYEAENFIFNGTTDFLISKGLKFPEKPYFFIQEFKKNAEHSDPEPQLLAELIAGIELNDWKIIKGAYIIGAIWNFVILEKLGKNSYQYFISQNFDSSKFEDLKGIYKNLLFVKEEIIEMLKRGD